jgi:phosphoribosyl-dephospho-CoA transferase
MSKHSDPFIQSLFCQEKVACARSRSVSVEEILTKTWYTDLMDQVMC